MGNLCIQPDSDIDRKQKAQVKWQTDLGSLKTNPKEHATYSEIEGLGNTKKVKEYQTNNIKFMMKESIAEQMKENKDVIKKTSPQNNNDMDIEFNFSEL